VIEFDVIEFVLFISVVASCSVGISTLVIKYLEGDFSKDKPIPKEGYNEYNLPKGCKLIQLGDKYMFKIKDKFVNMDIGDYHLWSYSGYTQAYGITTDKEFAIKRGIETFEFFKALGKI
jgi:hypothetical protein